MRGKEVLSRVETASKVLWFRDLSNASFCFSFNLKRGFDTCAIAGEAIWIKKQKATNKQVKRFNKSAKADKLFINRKFP